MTHGPQNVFEIVVYKVALRQSCPRSILSVKVGRV